MYAIRSYYEDPLSLPGMRIFFSQRSTTGPPLVNRRWEYEEGTATTPFDMGPFPELRGREEKAGEPVPPPGEPSVEDAGEDLP